MFAGINRIVNIPRIVAGTQNSELIIGHYGRNMLWLSSSSRPTTAEDDS
jgi:hypothetical protein